MNDISFTPFTIRELRIKNRFLMAAAVDGLADAIDARVQRYKKLAEGGVGLIIAGRVLNANESFEKVVEAIHKKGSRIALQILSHRGLGFDPALDSPAASIVSRESPKFSSMFPYGIHHEATESEIMDLIEDFAQAARLAVSFGADAVEVHSAHNSALMQFLSPLINRRKDMWGGPIENRVRVHKEVYHAVRSQVGNSIPILIKVGAEDLFLGGLTIAEGKVAAKLLAKYGYDAIEVSQGLQDFRDMDHTPMRMRTLKISQEAYFRTWCREIRTSIDKPTIMTGGIRSYPLVHEMLSNGETDLVGMCRPFISEPDLVNRWQGGIGAERAAYRAQVWRRPRKRSGPGMLCKGEMGSPCSLTYNDDFKK
jgi:2,4-dienoyl-CoA reductase-like NADH-dependent reductase (Old Yellow Enzyme family)